MGEGYHNWAKANADYRANQADIEAVVKKMPPAAQMKHLFPAGDDEPWPLSENGNVINFPFARSEDHLKIAKQIRSFFSSDSVPAIVPQGVGDASGGVNPLNGVTIQVRSSEDEDKDAAATLGQSKCRLYLAGADID